MEMSESVDMVDFKILKKVGYNYNELDLSGAGWCMCLPRVGGYLPIPSGDPEPEPEAEAEALSPDPDPETFEQTQGEISLNQSKQDQLGMDEVDNQM